MRTQRWILLALALSACGDSDGFEACGGDVTGVWNFTGGTVVNACSSGTPVVEGFLNFNSNGRYSVNLKSKAWQLHGAEACGFDSTHAGFWKQEGAVVCFADTAEALAAQPCDETAKTVDAPWSAAGEVCVEAAQLTFRSHTFFGLSSEAVLTLSK